MKYGVLLKKLTEFNTPKEKFQIPYQFFQGIFYRIRVLNLFLDIYLQVVLSLSLL